MNSTPNWLTETYIAHRGLFNEFCPENSLSAFKNAIEKNYAIEIDVQLLKDGNVIVFHDNNFNRVLEIDKYVSNSTLEEIKKYTFKNSYETIPTLKEVLDLVNGQVPLLIEVKNSLKVGELEKKTWEILKDYKGEFAIQSFNPYTLSWFKEHAPNVIRGQLSSFFKGEKLNFVKKSLLKKLKLNKVSCPHFISYNAENIPNKYLKKCELPILAWTIKSQDEYMKVIKYVDNIIFEGFIPSI